MSTNDMVKFLMPDGSEVSNDPRFDMEKAQEEMLASRPNTGDVGITHQEQTAQTQVEHLANLQSGQPGVGENAAPDPHDLIPNTGTPAMRVQKEDRQEAEEAGADLTSTSVQDPDPVDSNKAVLEVRKVSEEQAAAFQKAQEKLGEEGAGDPDVPKSEWTAAQLRMEVAARNADPNRAEGELIDVSGVKKKSQLAQLLAEDDDRQSAGGAPA
jgi:hypothetical protein